MLKRTPTDRAIERASQAAADFAVAIEGPDDGVAASVAAWIADHTVAWSAAHDTHRTELAPERAYAPHVSSRERARQFGTCQCEQLPCTCVASYPVLDGAPVGCPESLQAKRRESHAAADQARAEGRMTAKQLKNQARNARR